ncbi:MAG: hypothetical protein SVK08_09465 [Halobacteriota archaeon]|nr:hypothetical protein [Halobacteriota archaeon]
MDQRVNDYLMFVPVVMLLLACVVTSIFYLPVILALLLLGIVVTIPFIRRLPNEISMISAYMLLGLSAYTLVGLAYRNSYTTDPKDMFIASFPMVIFAIVNTIAVLITTEDKDSHGYTFSAMAFSVIFSNGIFSMGMQYSTLLLMLAVLWSLIPLGLCRIFSKQIFSSTTVFKRLTKAITGVILTFPLYLIVVAVSVLVIINQVTLSPSAIMSMDVVPNVLSSVQSEVTRELAILGVLWYYSLPHLIFIPGAYMIYRLILYDALGYEKHILRKTREIVYTAPEKEKTAKKAEDVDDPYQELFKDIKSQIGPLRQMDDRISAHEIMQRIKNEYDTLHAKHGDTALGNKAKEAINSIEEDFNSRFT